MPSKVGSIALRTENLFIVWLPPLSKDLEVTGLFLIEH
jgi:hypothetical protein